MLFSRVFFRCWVFGMEKRNSEKKRTVCRTFTCARVYERYIAYFVRRRSVCIVTLIELT